MVLAFLWAAHRIEPSIPFPPLLVAERIIRLTSGDVTYFIDALGPNATRLLTAMSVGTAILLAALLPRIAAVEGRPNARRAGVVVASLIGLTAFLAPQKPLLGGVAIASLMGGVLYWVALAWLIERSPGPPDPSRRQALISLTTAALGFAIGGTLVGRVDRRLAGPNTGVTIVSPELSSNAPAATAFPEIPGLAPRVTSVKDHYVVDIDLMDPVVEADGWILRIDGMVEAPLDLTFHSMQRDFTVVQEQPVLTCISNPVGGELVGSSAWTGVRLGEVLSRAGIHDGAADVVLRCTDGYSDSMPVQRALDPGVMLAFGQNDQPLAWEHGFPCRVRAPAVYGMKNSC